MTLTELQLYRLTQYIQSSGFTAGFTDVFSSTQPALLVQAGVFEQSEDNSKRIISIVQSGGNTSPTASRFTITPYRLFIVGLPSPANMKLERLITLGLATDIEKWINDNYQVDDCIYQVKITGSLSPIGETESGRPFIAISIELWESR